MRYATDCGGDSPPPGHAGHWVPRSRAPWAPGLGWLCEATRHGGRSGRRVAPSRARAPFPDPRGGRPVRPLRRIRFAFRQRGGVLHALHVPRRGVGADAVPVPQRGHVAAGAEHRDLGHGVPADRAAAELRAPLRPRAAPQGRHARYRGGGADPAAARRGTRRRARGRARGPRCRRRARGADVGVSTAAQVSRRSVPDPQADAASRRTVNIALASNATIAVAKLIAGLMTGSSAMLAETAHSVADTVNQGFLRVSLTLGAEQPTPD